MGHFSVETYAPPGSHLSANQQLGVLFLGGPHTCQLEPGQWPQAVPPCPEMPQNSF